MSVPTPFETSGYTEWTSLVDEAAFYEQLALDTDVQFREAGRSTANNPIYVGEIGTGAHTVLLTSLQHGDEPVTREVLMTLIRDLAYTTDPALLDYLSNHRIVFLTPCNPDGFPNSREIPGAGNLNRQHFSLASPEAKVMHEVIAIEQPQVALDLHERSGSESSYLTYQVEFIRPSSANLSLSINRACGEMYDVMKAAVIDAGYGYRDYPIPSRRLFSDQMALRNVVSMTVETYHTDPDRKRRHDAQLTALWAFFAWHDGDAVAEAVAAGEREAARAGRWRENFTIETTDEYTGPTISTTRPLGYTLADPEALELWEMLWGLQVSGGGLIGMDQPLGNIIPFLLDPQSDDSVAIAERVEYGRPVRVPGWVATVIRPE